MSGWHIRNKGDTDKTFTVCNSPGFQIAPVQSFQFLPTFWDDDVGFNVLMSGWHIRDKLITTFCFSSCPFMSTTHISMAIQRIYNLSPTSSAQWIPSAPQHGLLFVSFFFSFLFLFLLLLFYVMWSSSHLIFSTQHTVGLNSCFRLHRPKVLDQCCKKQRSMAPGSLFKTGLSK